MTEQSTIKSQAIVSYGPLPDGQWRLENVQLRQPTETEVVVQVVASGICHTDVHFGSLKEGFGVYYPRIMGHEGAGYVRQVGSKVTSVEPGDPVLMSFSSCEQCQICRSGHPGHCVQFNPINFEVTPDYLTASVEGSTQTNIPKIYGKFFGQSSFSSMTIANESSLVNVKGMVNTDEELQLLAPLGCGIQTGTGTIVNLGSATPDDRVAVVGLGGVGLSGIMGAKLRGCKTIIGIDLVQSRLELAKELGATHVINSTGLTSPGALAGYVKSLVGELTPTLTMDTTGVPSVILEAINFTSFKGKIFQVGSAPPDTKLDLPVYEFMVSGKQYIGAVEGDVVPQIYLPQLIRWVQDGSVPLKKIIKTYQAEDFGQAIKDMLSGETIKPIITW